MHRAGIASVLLCWAQHSPIKVPHPFTGQHMQKNGLSETMFFCFPGQNRECQ